MNILVAIMALSGRNTKKRQHKKALDDEHIVFSQFKSLTDNVGIESFDLEIGTMGELARKMATQSTFLCLHSIIKCC